MNHNYINRLKRWKDLLEVLGAQNYMDRLSKQATYHFDVSITSSKVCLGKIDIRISGVYLGRTIGWVDTGDFLWGDDFVFAYSDNGQVAVILPSLQMYDYLKAQSVKLADVVKTALK